MTSPNVLSFTPELSDQTVSEIEGAMAAVAIEATSFNSFALPGAEASYEQPLIGAQANQSPQNTVSCNNCTGK